MGNFGWHFVCRYQLARAAALNSFGMIKPAPATCNRQGGRRAGLGVWRTRAGGGGMCRARYGGCYPVRDEA